MALLRMRLIHVVVGLLLILSGRPAAAAEKPNVVMLFADDLGFRDIGVYDGPVHTPALDRLAAQGVRFTDFYAPAAVCSPSRASLLTGRHHIRAGIYSWIRDRRHASHLLEREVTLAEVLRSAGYETAHFGKWHLGMPTGNRDKPTPDRHGFDYWFATPNNASPSHRNPTNFIRNGERVGELEGYACQLVVDEAIGWLDDRGPGDRPFFLNVWFHEPHTPLAAPDDVVDDYGKPNNMRAVYSATIDNTDRAIGRLVEKLGQVDDPGNTLIIYASDNGSYLATRVGDLRGLKGTNWEGGIRVPGIFYWPGTIRAGAVESEPAGVVDILPTVCGLLGIEAPAGVHLDGDDLSPLLKADGGEFDRHQPLFWHLQKSRPIVAMRDGDYNLVADPAYDLSKGNVFQEKWIPKIKAGGYTNYRLYNLREDPGQTNDLSGEMPGKLEEMKRRLMQINDSIMADGPDWHLNN